MLNKKKIAAKLMRFRPLKNARRKFLYRNGPTLRIVNFHRVIDDGLPDYDYRVVAGHPSLSSFEKLIKHISSEYSLIDLEDYLNRGSDLLATEKLNIAITFDDGYMDNLTNAVPLLNKYQVPATFFCTTDSLDGGMLWFQKIYGLVNSTQSTVIVAPWLTEPIELSNKWMAMELIANSLKDLTYEEAVKNIDELCQNSNLLCYEDMLKWDDLAQLKVNPFVKVGAHSTKHWNLTRLSDEDLKYELDVPLNRLGEFLDKQDLMIAYPNGKYDERVTKQVEKSGYLGGFIMNRGINSSLTNKFALHREYCEISPDLLDFQMHEFDTTLNSLLNW